MNALKSIFSWLGRFLEKARAIKKALMQDLLTGKVRVAIDKNEKELVIA